MTEFQPLAELEKLLGQSGATPSTVFPPNSRYARTEIVLLSNPDGSQTAYLRRRFVPAPEAFATAKEIEIVEADRLDNVAAENVGDPEMFWLLCDANRVLHPSEMEVLGLKVKVPYPQGVPEPRTNK